MLENAESFFYRHGGKSILLGRFVGPIRPIIPMVAGMLGMKPMAFTVINVLSAIGWALVYILPGLFLGTSLAVTGAVSTRLAIILFSIIACVWLLGWLVRKLVRLIERRGPVWISRLNNWLSMDTHESGFFRFAKRFLSYLFLGPQEDALRIGFLLVLLLGAGWSFGCVLRSVLTHGQLAQTDRAVYHLLHMLRSPWADHFFVAVSEFGDYVVTGFLAAAVLVLLLIRRCKRTALFWTLAVFGGMLGVEGLKAIIQLPRPASFYHTASTYGFPSGHTFMSMVIYGFLTIVVVRGLPCALRRGLGALALAIALLTGLSRLYLGVHWLSDVLGGLLLGTAWIALLGIPYLKSPADVIPRRALAGVVLLSLLLVGSWHITQHHASSLADYAPRYESIQLTQEEWLDGGWQRVFPRRTDVLRENTPPLTIQYAASSEELEHILRDAGWSQPQSLTLTSFLVFFSPDTPITALPVLPQLHDGRTDTIRLVRENQGRRWVLRMWPSSIQIEGSATPLYAGTIEIQNRHPVTGLMTAAKDTTNDYEHSLNTFASTLLHAPLQIAWANRQSTELMDSPPPHQQPWKNRVLLIWK